MTVKVFRLHEEGKSSADWFESVEYNEAVIRGISDPTGDHAHHQITSIPSPFARIDLVKTAFEYVVRAAEDRNATEESKQLNGNTIYHRMVSECLDIGEIFFNIDSLKNKVTIVSWDKNHDLNELLNSNNQRHRLLGRTLKLYLEQDAENYNFDQLNKIYLIKDIKTDKILGGTSPITLFFSAADDLSFVDITFDNDRLFDNQYNPLYKRSPDYQKFLNHYIRTYNIEMTFFNRYLTLSNEQSSFYQEIRNLNPDNFDHSYDELNMGQRGNVVEVLGNPLRKRKGVSIEEISDFVILSEKYKEPKKPLVLQKNFNLKLKYTERLWDEHIDVPYFNPESILTERTLPGCDIQYPYLTVSDFLEPNLIKLIYPINKSYFQTGNISPNDNIGFLLPLKKAFFDFFDTGDLFSTQANKPKLEIRQNGNKVTVILLIPIKNRKYITFERTYATDTQEASEANNEGKIVEKAFSIVIFPCFKVPDINNEYRVMLIDTSTGQGDYQLYFSQNQANTLIQPKSEVTRSDKSANNTETTKFFVINNNFDFIQVVHEEMSGIIIPKFKENPKGSEIFTFAVDFGTTNTHIEYKTGTGKSIPVPFDITEEDCQIATLHDPTYDSTSDPSWYPIGSKFLHELIPYKLEEQGEFKFPQRTVLSQSKTWQPEVNPLVALAVGNIPFTYEKRRIPKEDSKIITDLKWGDYGMGESRKQITAFLEVIVFLIRHKILLNSGALDKTTLIWLYPSSMNKNKVDILEKIWEDLVAKHIHPNVIPKKLPEAIAPFYFYNTYHHVSAADKPVVSIDIGGGTTDIVIFKGESGQESACATTSFRFAGNAVFGDGYGGRPDNNGFYRKHGRKILGDKLKSKDTGESLTGLLKDVELEKAFEDIKKEEKSDDLIAAFFSLQENKRLLAKDIEIKFSEWLENDPQLKIVFLLFYSAILYHLAQFMKANNLEYPDSILFSGTASKILNLADQSKNLDGLAHITQHIFQKIYADIEVTKITLKQCPQPKEITCKGAVLAKDIVYDNKIKSVFSGSLSIPNDIHYDALNDDVQEKIIIEVNKFIDFFGELHEKAQFKNNFGIDANLMDKSKPILKEKLMRHLKDGCNRKLKEIKGSEKEPIDETLFFYPLIGALHKLAADL